MTQEYPRKMTVLVHATLHRHIFSAVSALVSIWSEYTSLNASNDGTWSNNLPWKMRNKPLLQRIRCSERFIDTLSFRWALNLCEYKYTMRSKQKRCAKKVNSILIISITPNGQSFKHMRWTMCWTMNEKWKILLVLLQTTWNRNEVANKETKKWVRSIYTLLFRISNIFSIFDLLFARRSRALTRQSITAVTINTIRIWPRHIWTHVKIEIEHETQ